MDKLYQSMETLFPMEDLSGGFDHFLKGIMGNQIILQNEVSDIFRYNHIGNCFEETNVFV